MSSTAAKDETTEHNKKLKAYAFIAIFSLINVASIAEAKDTVKATHFLGRATGINLLWGLFTLILSILIIITDVVDFIREKIDFKTIMDGKLEGYTLFGFVTIWTIGLICLTRAGGLGYSALNVYFSTWTTFFGCIHCFDLWLGEKDYVTIQKLCSLSATLPYWWILWFASIVTFGSAADARRLVDGDDVSLAKESCDLAIAIGVISFLLASFFILSHYEFLTCCSPCRTWMSYGGIFELTIIVFVDIWQVIATHTLTSAGKIGSTITGQGEGVAEDYVPGSNIYFAVWASLAASMSITVKWKQARAMKFAQTQNEVNEEERLGDDEEA